MNLPYINRDNAVTESATGLWQCSSSSTSPANGAGPVCLCIRCRARDVQPVRKVQGRGTTTYKQR